MADRLKIANGDLEMEYDRCGRFVAVIYGHGRNQHTLMRLYGPEVDSDKPWHAYTSHPTLRTPEGGFVGESDKLSQL